MWVNPSLAGSLVRSAWKTLEDTEHFYLQHRAFRGEIRYRIITRRFPHYKLSEGEELDAIRDEFIFLNDVVVAQVEGKKTAKKIAAWMRRWLSGVVQIKSSLSAMTEDDDDFDGALLLPMDDDDEDDEDEMSTMSDDGASVKSNAGTVHSAPEAAYSDRDERESALSRRNGQSVPTVPTVTTINTRAIPIRTLSMKTTERDVRSERSVKRQDHRATLMGMPIAASPPTIESHPLHAIVPQLQPPLSGATHRPRLSRTGSSLSLNEDRLEVAARELDAAEKAANTSCAVLKEESTPWLVLPPTTLDPSALPIWGAVNRVGRWLIDEPQVFQNQRPKAIDESDAGNRHVPRQRFRRRQRADSMVAVAGDTSSPRPATPNGPVAWHEMPWQFVALLTYPDLSADPAAKIPLAVLRDVALVRQRRRVLMLLSLWTFIIRYCSFDLFLILLFLSNCVMLYLMKNSRQVNSAMAKRALKQRLTIMKQWAGGWVRRGPNGPIAGSAGVSDLISPVQRPSSANAIPVLPPWHKFKSSTSPVYAHPSPVHSDAQPVSPHTQSRYRLGFFRGKAATTGPGSAMISNDAASVLPGEQGSVVGYEERGGGGVVGGGAVGGRLRFFRKGPSPSPSLAASAPTPMISIPASTGIGTVQEVLEPNELTLIPGIDVGVSEYVAM